MANIAKLLKEEIQRLARKEIRTAQTDINKTLSRQRKIISELRQRIIVLERKQAQVAGKTKNITKSTPTGSEKDNTTRFWITAKGIRSMRKKMKLTQGEFAQLLGVTTQAVYQWEHKEGKLSVRSKVKKAVQDVRGLGAREARVRLAEMGCKTDKRRGRKKLHI